MQLDWVPTQPFMHTLPFQVHGLPTWSEEAFEDVEQLPSVMDDAPVLVLR